MTIPQCQAHQCAGVADDGTSLCAAHRRALTLTTQMQDAVREYVNGGHWDDVIRPTPDNATIVVEAGTRLAEGVALLVSTRFEDVSFDPSPIYAADLAFGTNTPWRVNFSWRSTSVRNHSDDDDESDDDQL